MIKIRKLHKATPLVIGGAALLVLLLAGCGQRTQDPSKTLATVNGKAITVSEFDLRWSQLPEFARKKYLGPEGRKGFLEELIDREVLLQEAQKRGIEQDRILLDRVERFKERSVLDKLVREEVDSRVSVSPEEIKARYDANPSAFTAPDEFRASHILVRSETEAVDLKKQLDEGKDFAALARTMSVDTNTKNKGGDLGIVKRGQMLPEFENALMRLKPREVSGPVGSQFGYHVIKLISRTAGQPLSFDQAKEQVREQLLVDKKQKRFKELVGALRSDAKIRVSEGQIPSTDPAPAATPAADGR
jgi:peptidyl-prolyl cis-trans isomerase C